MDATELALLAGVCAAPDDDTQRLVYADWLQENGQADRAEFIRVQVELAQPTEGVKSVQRQDELFRWPNIENWFTHGYAFRHFVDREQYDKCDVGSQVLIARGFMERMTCSTRDLFTNASKLFWRPDQTDQCSWCNGNVTYLPPGRAIGGPFSPFETCAMCVKGCVARPCPPTAQPITHVTLTDRPVLSSTRGNFVFVDDPTREEIPNDVTHAVYEPDELVSVCLRYRFQGIGFTVPPAPQATYPEPETQYIDYVACGDGYLPATGWEVWVQTEPDWGRSRRLPELVEGPPRILLSLTYPRFAGPPGVPPRKGDSFGPITGTLNGDPVTIERAVLTRVEPMQALYEHQGLIRVEAIAVGQLTSNR